MAELNIPLRIIAQPKALYRERYSCEIDQSRKQSPRFIRAETNLFRLEYPTIEIPQQWDSQGLYIRVTLVTVCSKEVPVRYIHPYPIDTPQSNVIKDVKRNTLYFPISKQELNDGCKSFCIIRKKLTQVELKDYGQLSLLNTDEIGLLHIDDSHDPRKIIDVYQLKKSQFLFSVAELCDDDLFPGTYDETSVYSQIMSASRQTKTTPIKYDESNVRCVPQKGCWQGGDDILMVIPKLDKRKACHVYIECSSSNTKSQIPFEFVDMKTIAFTTPPCPIQAIGNQNIELPLVVSQKGEEIARLNFVYESCK
ncbi:unnamed protein product [Rotaria sp. Silwood1]|nr:unnamed protein product [Rotaria sp. Silwood1]